MDAQVRRSLGRDLPREFPSLSTCWSRLDDWSEAGVLERIWVALLDQLNNQQPLDWNELFVDGTFSPAKRRGLCVGKTKRGKGTKWMLLVDGHGLPLACRTASASPAEVTLVEDLTAKVTVKRGPIPLIADRAYDSDPHRARLKRQGFDLVCPHRRGRKRPATQDGRKLRRYRRRWKVERTISWLGNCRRLLVRHEYRIPIFQGFITLACLMLCLKRF